MNIKHAFLAILMGTSMLVTTGQIACSQIIDDEEEQENWIESYDEQQEKNWFESCAVPCIAGGLIGYTSGKISVSICKGSLVIAAIATIIAEDKAKEGTIGLAELSAIKGILGLAGLSAVIGTLIAENKLRARCVDWLNKKFEYSGIQPNDLTRKSAQIFSWITFLSISIKALMILKHNPLLHQLTMHDSFHGLHS